MRSFVFWLGACVWLGLGTEARAQSLSALQKTLQGLDAAVVINDTRSGAFLRLNEARLTQEFPPFNTLEIPVALAALETRTVRHLNELTPWNRFKYPPPETSPVFWNEDHTMRSAFAHSVPWYWQDLSERLGASRLDTALGKFAYGDQTLSVASPRCWPQCWQDGALRISAQAQTDFLIKLINETLPASKWRQRELKMLLLRESGDGYRLYLKTGVGFLQSGYYLGWSIGWLETTESNYVFALNLTHRELEFVNEAVSTLPKQVLMAAGYWVSTE
jgi:beta-lactamase class D